MGGIPASITLGLLPVTISAAAGDCGLICLQVDKSKGMLLLAAGSDKEIALLLSGLQVKNEGSPSIIECFAVGGGFLPVVGEKGNAATKHVCGGVNCVLGINSTAKTEENILVIINKDQLVPLTCIFVQIFRYYLIHQSAENTRMYRTRNQLPVRLGSERSAMLLYAQRT